MAHLNQDDIQELFELFEAELRLLWHVDRLEKMRLRRRIRNALMPIVTAQSLDPDIAMGAIKDKLGDVIRLFRDRRRFMEKLWDFLADKLIVESMSIYEKRKRRLRAVGG